MTVPIVLGREAQRLSEVIEQHYFGDGCFMYFVAGRPIETEKEAFYLARKWFPELVDDERL